MRALLIIAVIAVALALLNMLVMIDKIKSLTGNTVGYANLTIESSININFTTNTINWGSGMVSVGQTSATLNTAAGANNVTNGNWTGNSNGLVIQNMGNVNATLVLAAGKSNVSFLGGTNPAYQWNITNSEPNSCINSTGINLGLFWDTNGTAKVCDTFEFLDNKDTVRIDFKLVIPYDSVKGALSDTITATATAA